LCNADKALFETKTKESKKCLRKPCAKIGRKLKLVLGLNSRLKHEYGVLDVIFKKVTFSDFKELLC